VTQESDRVRLDRTNELQADVPRAELLELYKIVIDEYRFQIRLNWDRTQYYFVFNTAMVTAAATVLATLKAWGAVVALFMFVLGGTSAVLGRETVTKGHEYYRRIVYRKTLIEDLLGRLHRLPGYTYEDAALNLATTDGMADARKILNDTEAYFATPLRPRTVTHSLLTILRVFVVVDAAGIGLACVQIVRSIL
jgi:hypothetical protein